MNLLNTSKASASSLYECSRYTFDDFLPLLETPVFVPTERTLYVRLYVDEVFVLRVLLFFFVAEENFARFRLEVFPVGDGAVFVEEGFVVVDIGSVAFDGIHPNSASTRFAINLRVVFKDFSPQNFI